jgi:hypothetical protein
MRFGSDGPPKLANILMFTNPGLPQGQCELGFNDFSYHELVTTVGLIHEWAIVS